MLTKLDFRKVTQNGLAYRKKIYNAISAFQGWPKGIFSPSNRPKRRTEPLDNGKDCVRIVDPSHRSHKDQIRDILEAGQRTAEYYEAFHHFKNGQPDNGFVDPLNHKDVDLIDIHNARVEYNKKIDAILRRRQEIEDSQREDRILAEAERIRKSKGLPDPNLIEKKETENVDS